LTHNLVPMSQQLEPTEAPFEVEKLGWRDFFMELIQAIGVTVGLALLWGLEIIRNRFFRLLDRLNIKPRRRRASAFPPGVAPRRLRRAAGDRTG